MCSFRIFNGKRLPQVIPPKRRIYLLACLHSPLIELIRVVALYYSPNNSLFTARRWRNRTWIPVIERIWCVVVVVLLKNTLRTPKNKQEAQGDDLYFAKQFRNFLSIAMYARRWNCARRSRKVVRDSPSSSPQTTSRNLFEILICTPSRRRYDLFWWGPIIISLELRNVWGLCIHIAFGCMQLCMVRGRDGREITCQRVDSWDQTEKVAAI